MKSTHHHQPSSSSSSSASLHSTKPFHQPHQIKHDSFSISSPSSTSTSTSNHDLLHKSSSSLSRPHHSHLNLNSNSKSTSIETELHQNIIHQNIIRTRIQSKDQTTFNQAGLEVVMYLKVSIPYRSLSKLNSRSISIPLISDHNLRLKKSIIFPLTRKSTHSKPTLQALPNRSQANSVASILNLSKSFRLNPPQQPSPPPATISVRNFSISLLISLPQSTFTHPSSDLGNHDHALVEYALVLESLCLWTTSGPDWPYSVIIPTPTCLRNSFRLMLPPDDENEDDDRQHHPSNKFNVITSPTLRRERSTISSTRFNEISTSKSCPIISDEESKSLTDESEPDYSGLSEDDEISPRPSDWTQDETSPRYEGVFQSTKELCVAINHQSPNMDPSITAQRAETNLAISIHRGKHHLSSDLNSLSLSLNFQVTLYNLALSFDQPMIPFVFHLPDHIANQIISSEWSGITGDSVIESLVPFHDAQPDPSPAVPSAQENTPRNSSTKQIPSLFKETSLPDLELLHTSAPFEDSPSDPPENSPWGAEDGDVEASFETSFSTPMKTRNLLEQHSSPQINKIPGDVRGRFVVWFDLGTLIRYIDSTNNSQDKLVLNFNLHGQIEVGLKNEVNQEKVLDLPLFGFPNVEQHTCIIDLSVDPSLSPSDPELDLRLPSSATRLDLEKGSEDDKGCQIRVKVRRAGPEMGKEETVKLYHSKPVLQNETVSIASLLSPIQGFVSEPMRKPRLKKRYSTTSSKYRHSHTISSGSLQTYRKRTPLAEQLQQIKSHEIQSSDPQDESESEMKLTIASADIDISFLPSSASSCQYLDLSLQILKDGGNGRAKVKEEQGIIGLTFAIGWSDQVKVIEGWIGSKRLEVGHGIQIMGQDSKLEHQQKSIDLRLSLLDHLSNVVTYQGQLIVRVVLKIERSSKESTSSKGFRPVCVLPTFSTSVSILDVKVRNSNDSNLKVTETSLINLSTRSTSLIHLREYTLEPKVTHTLTLEKEEEMKEEMKIEGFSWIERQLERYDFSWKSVLNVWILYLILSLSFEINLLHSKFDLLERGGDETKSEVIKDDERHFGSFDVIQDSEEVQEDRFRFESDPRTSFLAFKESEQTCDSIPLEKVKIKKEKSLPIQSSSIPKEKANEEGKEPKKQTEEERFSSVGSEFGYFEQLWMTIWIGIQSIFG
ncbi:hypothetical protein DFH28DRAFT_1122936 [Melampsora americana]|nr:hypothetical protein DFH28DRAFT_1122936 [Melampsora americana]